ncbi:MAG: hypothetical protein WCF10_12365 [Polyangiales bacterium]
MKRAAIVVAIFAVLGFAGGFLYAKVTTQVVPKFKASHATVNPRLVSADWRTIRLSPGHSQHVINQGIDCDKCHDPTKPDFSGVDTGVCTGCHEEQASLAHVNLDGTPMDCYTCHVFDSQPNVFGRWDCVRCHGPFETVANEGLAMHNSVPCETCHNPHKPIAETVRKCDECHNKIDVQHGDQSLSGPCSGCHGGHKLASQASACMKCHKTREPVVPESATFAGGHDSCANCHRPHSFTPATALRCNSCHETKQVLAQNIAAPHRDCISCHQPHAVRSVSGQTCKGCHRDVVSTHPVASQGDCIGCHEPHPKRAAQIALQCSQCHEEAKSDTAFHAGKIACTGCHQPHRFDLSKLSDRNLCSRCHVLQIRLTSSNLGHASCRGCHQGTVHELTGVAACASCHKDKIANSPSGHQKCLTCHEPHGGKVLPQIHCTGCHKANELPGLHRIADQPIGEGHTQCTACHDIHQNTVRANRANCMNCHEDVANHQPGAKRCTGCHTFIKGR